MAGITEVKSLAARKQALVAESEIYRQALAMEVQNLRFAGERIKRNLRFLRLLKPILLVAPVAGSIIGLRSGLKNEKVPERQPKGWRKWLAAAMMSWRLYRRAAPILTHFRSRRSSNSRFSRHRFGEMSP